MVTKHDEIMNIIKSQLSSPELKETLDYIWEIKRLESLKNWTMTTPSAKELAEAGFYCPNMELTGSVKCFACFIELDGWEPTDNPWEEHKKRALALKPPCKFIEIGKKEFKYTVNDFLEIQKSVMMRILNARCEMNLKVALDTHAKKKKALKKDLQKLGLF